MIRKTTWGLRINFDVTSWPMNSSRALPSSTNLFLQPRIQASENGDLNHQNYQNYLSCLSDFICLSDFAWQNRSKNGAHGGTSLHADLKASTSWQSSCSIDVSGRVSMLKRICYFLVCNIKANLLWISINRLAHIQMWIGIISNRRTGNW